MTASHAAVPSIWARRLGYAGLLPFVLLAMATWVAEPEQRAFAGFALAGYGAVIASFLGAIHWGLAMRDASKQSLALLGWGVMPSLFAWVAMMLGTATGLLVIAAVLWACFAVDRVVYPRFQAQAWLPMRLALTCIASASCALGATRLHPFESIFQVRKETAVRASLPVDDGNLPGNFLALVVAEMGALPGLQTL